MMRWQIIFRGHVQGVGFRYSVKSLAAEYDVTGWIRNRADGYVEMVCEGCDFELRAFLARILSDRADFVDDHELHVTMATGEYATFDIRR
jgi:acylphosphatase